MASREMVLVAVFLIIPCAGGAQEKPKGAAPSNAASGKRTFMDYCASCHGPDGRGHGPAASALKTAPPDLRILAIRHDGKFPESYVKTIVRSGDPKAGHGSAEMPV